MSPRDVISPECLRGAQLGRESTDNGVTQSGHGALAAFVALSVHCQKTHLLPPTSAVPTPASLLAIILLRPVNILKRTNPKWTR